MSISGKIGLNFNLDDPPVKRIVAMCEFQGRLYVAAETGLYVKGDDDILRLVKFDRPKKVEQNAVDNPTGRDAGSSQEHPVNGAGVEKG